MVNKAHLCVCVYLCVCVCVHACTHVCVHVCMCACMRACVCLCVCVPATVGVPSPVGVPAPVGVHAHTRVPGPCGCACIHTKYPLHIIKIVNQFLNKSFFFQIFGKYYCRTTVKTLIQPIASLTHPYPTKNWPFQHSTAMIRLFKTFIQPSSNTVT